MIIVTAGHVDHGKTSLIQALTGTDADRLPEEKQRGMTIELGYAFMDLADGERLAFVDVPGHSKFINTMLAGVSCAKHALLIIACDDGVMPQTHEHLAILQLLNLEHLIVVLTKQDKVDCERVEMVKLEVSELLAQHHRQSAIYVVSAQTGFGVSELSLAIKQLAETQTKTLSHSSLESSFRMAIDRAFSVKGAGLVVTGTVISGQVAQGQSLYLSGQRKAVKVRTLHSQGRASDNARHCQRVALNLTGVDQHRGALRGDWLTALEPIAPPKVICGVFESCLPFKHWQSVQVHLGNSHTTARLGLLHTLADGQSLVELQCELPLHCVEQDRIIVRDAAARTTLGALRVLDINPPKRGKRSSERLAYLAALKECSSVKCSLLVQTQDHCVEKSAFMRANQLTEQTPLIADEQLLELDGYLLSHTLKQQIEAQLLTLVEDYHQASPELLGLSINRLQRMTHGQYPLPVLLKLTDCLREQQLLQSTRGLLHLPRHSLSLSEQELQLWLSIKQLMLAANGPLWSSDLAKQLNLEITTIRALCRKLIQLGYLSAIIKDRFMLTERLYFYADVIRQQINVCGEIKTADFNSIIKLGRKASIQLLEFYDRSGLTWRKKKDNSRVIRDGSIFIMSDLAEEHRS
ncbi:selenocysteine-specific translation elongation factor [Shewanella schlegeliana]|uniref:Selenocysteine-specific translation elongation factor n=1 Tax=Shewanella schlegeliana TaxID=190308 RepID=A0ABS1T1Z6_9GAMM|nr:selenocysteine-specific translation elongation factor [Shewanella schlegeliana]MBL4914827.1 selenocysteine-specific translation elongation factor [Shewanella schlegeliana]MCL1110482.1 selenocysteine-specific translation elongation factor [Shewanella schlegeliana]GIU27470.1 selenocysteine-specific translation elongation factor [Shewanella schlegeliana]